MTKAVGSNSIIVKASFLSVLKWQGYWLVASDDSMAKMFDGYNDIIDSLLFWYQDNYQTKWKNEGCTEIKL